ncbi:FtsX-like permease family protein [Liquorilactobacillus capillatus]|uniref:Efflux ABC transporter, permease protein n=1 Tax=Liquorilactobacillus capillatus DSM 19910 TaxID=1423731 RepID=A0A0R1LZL6_9LACO|nr:FtsX-like permease family protein [Liquorilactobacillus capillatus]KRL01117.1 efflux ABC transporter, permease protein [Liquorilactobacillus capillatus DSM 19910]
MIHLKLAWHGVTHHKQEYGPFLLASSVLIAINFIFWNIVLNRTLKSMPLGAATIEITTVAIFFTSLISVFLIFYANSFLMKQRGNELGLYNMIGLSNGDLRWILLLETILLYIFSLIVGVITGFVFLKLAFLVLQKLLDLKESLNSFEPQAALLIIGIFGIIFLALLLYNFYRIHAVNPIHLWNQSFQGEKEPRAKKMLAIFGLAILAWGYWISIRTKPSSQALTSFMLAVALVVIGTYLLFIVGSISFLKLLKKQKKLYYKPNYFISISGMLFRMKQNGAGLASICLLCTSILVTMVGTLSLYVGKNKLISSWNPYDIVFTTKNKLSDEQKQTIAKTAAYYHLSVGAKKQMIISMPTAGSIEGNHFEKSTIMNATHQLTTLTIDDYNRLQGTKLKLKPHQILLYEASQKFNEKNLFIYGQRYQVKKITNFKMAFNYRHSTFQPLFIVTANEAVGEKINPQPKLNVTGFNIGGTKANQLKFANSLQQKLKFPNEDYSAAPIIENLFSSFFGALLFVGSLVSLTLIFATALILYYKQLSEGYADRRRFQTMQQVGLSQAETKKAIRSQVSMVFMLPIIGATIHFIVCIPLLKSILSLFSMYNTRIFTSVGIMTLAVLTGGYLCIYLITTKVYQQLVNEKDSSL